MGMPVGEFVQFKNDVPELQKTKPEGKDFVSIFGKICKTVSAV